MDKELIDRTWSALPKEFKEEVKYEYRRVATKATKDEYDLGFMHAHEGMFGIHNLTSDVEGEEMLMVSRKRVQEIYTQNQNEIIRENVSSSDKDCYETVNEVLKTLYGSKCLPDEVGNEDNFTTKESKPAEPKYGLGDKVMLNGCGGFVITSFYLDPYTQEYKYRLGGFKGHFCESDLETYTGPEENIAENRNFSQDCDKHFDAILKDGFQGLRRLNIATQVLCAITPKYQDDGDGIGLSVLNEKNMIKCAYRLADALIAEAEKGGLK